MYDSFQDTGRQATEHGDPCKTGTGEGTLQWPAPAWTDRHGGKGTQEGPEGSQLRRLSGESERPNSQRSGGSAPGGQDTERKALQRELGRRAEGPHGVPG